MVIDLQIQKISIYEALKLAKPYDTIYLDDCSYYEKITIRIPHLTLKGRKKSRIYYDASHGTIIPACMGGDGLRVFGTTGSATVLITPEAEGFCASDIIFENTFKRNGKTNGQAVAFKSECSYLVVQHCQFLSEQDTLYIDMGKHNKIEDSYIEGDIDFIFGSADCVFKNCLIYAKNSCGKAYFLAPDTYEDQQYGFIFKNCQFKKETPVQAILGRAWYPSKALKPVYPRVTLLDCIIEDDIPLELIQMHEGDPKRSCLKVSGKDNCRMEEEYSSTI